MHSEWIRRSLFMMGSAAFYSLTLSVADEVTVATNDGPEGSSGVTIAQVRHSLDSALAEDWGVSGNYYRKDFTLSDGNFQVDLVNEGGELVQALVPASGTVNLHAKMFSPGERFDYSAFTYVPASDAQAGMSGVAYFTEAYVGIDEDMDGIVTLAERQSVIDGVISFEGILPLDLGMSFTMTLANGQSVSGEYTGLIEFADR